MTIWIPKLIFIGMMFLLHFVYEYKYEYEYEKKYKYKYKFQLTLFYQNFGKINMKKFSLKLIIIIKL